MTLFHAVLSICIAIGNVLQHHVQSVYIHLFLYCWTCIVSTQTDYKAFRNATVLYDGIIFLF